MINDHTMSSIGTRSPHWKLANDLLEAVGKDAAIYACYQNLWYGTLSVILRDEKHSR